MKLTQIQKELLFESAKKLFLEADYPIVPYNTPQSKQAQPGSNTNTQNEQPKGDTQSEEWEGYEDYKRGDEFDPKDFRRCVENLFTTYKHILSATKSFITTVGTYILRYQKGELKGSSLFVAIRIALNRPTKKQPGEATKRSLNKAGHQFNELMTELRNIVASTNIPFNKKLYGFFYQFLEDLRQEHIQKTDQYFRYIAYLSYKYFRTFDFAKHIPDKTWVEKLHEISFETENWVDKKLEKYYKMMFNDVGTNKGFYRMVRDMFMKHAPYESAEPDETNEYTGVKPDHTRKQIGHTGTDYEGAEHIYYVEYNRLLNLIHELTQKFIDSNYKDMNIKNQIQEVKDKIEELQSQRQQRAPNKKLKSKLQDIEDKYKGWGSWSDFSDKGSQPKSPNFRDNNYRSKEAPKEQPRYRTGNYDPDLEDYRRRNSPYDEED